MIFNIIGFLIGLMIVIAGIYYLIKEKDDKESKKIYSIITIFGLVITVFVIIKALITVL